MKTFESLNKKQKDDINDLIDILEAYLTLWGYQYTNPQMQHIKEMLSIIIKTNTKTSQ